MATDEEKCKLAKLLQGLEVPEVKIPERSFDLYKEIQQKFASEVETESMDDIEDYENPYIPDKKLVEEIDKKLRDLLSESRRPKKSTTENSSTDNVFISDPMRPWRTNSSKERLLRIDGDLKRHMERGLQAIAAMDENDIKELVEECRQETRVSAAVGADRLRETVDEARKHLPNFQYRKIENSTATAIFIDAHQSNQEVVQPRSMLEDE